MRRMGMLVVLTFALALALITACGGDETAEKKPTPDSPIASEPGWLAYQTTGQGDEFTDEVHLVRVDGSKDHAIASNLPGRQNHPDFSRDGSRLAFDQLTSEESSD